MTGRRAVRDWAWMYESYQDCHKESIDERDMDIWAILRPPVRFLLAGRPMTMTCYELRNAELLLLRVHLVLYPPLIEQGVG
jgi:hypothetical protein